MEMRLLFNNKREKEMSQKIRYRNVDLNVIDELEEANEVLQKKFEPIKSKRSFDDGTKTKKNIKKEKKKFTKQKLYINA